MRDLTIASRDCIIEMILGTQARLDDIIENEGYEPSHVRAEILAHAFYCTGCGAWHKMEDISAITGEDDICETCANGEGPEKEIA